MLDVCGLWISMPTEAPIETSDSTAKACGVLLSPQRPSYHTGEHDFIVWPMMQFIFKAPGQTLEDA